jgi:hypothetical protein
MSLTLALNHLFVFEPHLWHGHSRFDLCELHGDLVKSRFNELVQQAQAKDAPVQYPVDSYGSAMPVNLIALSSARIILKEWKDSNFHSIQFSDQGLRMFANNLIVDVEDLRAQVRNYKELALDLRDQVTVLQRANADQETQLAEMKIKLDHEKYQRLKVGVGSAAVGFGFGVAVSSFDPNPE